MNLTKSIKNFFGKALNFVSLRESDPGIYSLLGQDYRFGTQSKDFLLNAYGGNPYVYTVVDRIVQRMVRLDRLILNSNEKEIRPDAAFLELWDRPNEKESTDTFLYRAGSTYLATGEVFVVRDIALGERDQYFIPVNYNVTINEDVKGNVISYTISKFGHLENYLPPDVLHIQKPDITFDTNRGFSPLRATRKVWESNNEVWASEASLHKNKGVTGVLYSDGNRPMTDPEQKALQNQYDTDNTGVKNFGKVKVSTAKLGYIQMGMNPNDLKSIESRLDHLRTTCASYNVDSKLFGDSQASTYNNMAEAQRAFILNAVLPLADLLLPKISKFISRNSIFRVYYVKPNEEKISELQITKEQRSARIGREVVQGVLSPAQARQMLYPDLLIEDEEGKPPPVITQQPTAQDLISLQQAVTAGTLPRPGAVAILLQYGFTEETANEILGDANE